MTGDIEGNESRIGFNVGVNVDIPLLQSLYVQTGLYATQKGFKAEEGDGKATPLYLEIPILASYRYNFSDATQWQFNIGPYLAYGISGKEGDYDFFGDGEDQAGGKRFDMGLQIGSGVTFNKFYVGCAYEFGLTDVYDEEDWSIKNSNFMINLGYNF